MATGPLIVLVGPTASGKSALGMKLAQQFGGEIICADSRTVYKGLDIGTAKPSEEDRKIVPHHLLDVVNPDESFAASDFKKQANEAIKSITDKGRLPIMVGGSGLYIDAVLFDFQFSGTDAPRDPQNPRHVSRDAPQSRSELRKDTLVVGLLVDPAILKQRIVNRVDKMLEDGFLSEVQWLESHYPNSKAALAPGYKAFAGLGSGDIELEQAKNLFVRNDFRLAKRQMTWFRRNKSIQWVEEQSAAVDIVSKFMSNYK